MSETISKSEILKVLEEADCLHNEKEVSAAIKKLAEDIICKYSDANPVCLTVMNGGVVLAGQLLPKLNFPLETDYIHATRYTGKTTGGQIEWYAKPKTPLEGRTVLLLDDILDEGYTLAEIRKYCLDAGALAVSSVVLVNKLHDRKAEGAVADFVGLDVVDRYLFGCGMDYKGYLRNYLSIYAVKGM